MNETPSSTELEKWHRWFAVEGNNRAWALSVQQRTASEDAEMLDAAHASAFHWNAVGTEQNTMRAKMLLAEVHAQLGMGESALAQAKEMHAWFLSRDTPDWEIALSYTILAHAAQVAGERSTYEEEYAQAKAAIDAIGDPEEKAIVIETLRQITKP